MTSALSGDNLIQNSCWDKVVESKWTDAALITGFVALLIIGIAASTGAFSAIETTNAAHLSYGMYAGAVLLLATEIAKLVRNYCCKDNHPDDSHNLGVSQLGSGNNPTATNTKFEGQPTTRHPKFPSQDSIQDLQQKDSGVTPPSQSLVTTNNTSSPNHPNVEIVTEEIVDHTQGTVYRSITGTATIQDESGGNVRLEQHAREIKGEGFTMTRFSRSYEAEIDGIPASEWLKKNGVEF